MNYIKIFRGSDELVEREANAYLALVAEKGHRVMGTHPRVRDTETWLTIVFSDHPSKHTASV